MGYQTVFKRYEIKYLLTPEQKRQVLAVMEPHMALDQYGRTTIRNIYYDTDSFQLIRHSLERPAYKEKLRVRSYHQAQPDEPVFVELKKKYDSVVYKRRLAVPLDQAMDCLCGGTPLPVRSQIADEIDYFRQYYRTLHPVVFLSYERDAFYALDGSDFRVTFDENILCRREAMSLTEPPYGTPLLPEGMTLMEIKTPGAIPLWLTHCLTRQQIFKTSYSKYGTAYTNLIFNHTEGETIYA